MHKLFAQRDVLYAYCLYVGTSTYILMKSYEENEIDIEKRFKNQLLYRNMRQQFSFQIR